MNRDKKKKERDGAEDGGMEEGTKREHNQK